MKQNNFQEISQPKVITNERKSKITTRGKLAIGALALSVFAAGHTGLNKLEEHNKRQDHIEAEYKDFGKYGLADNPKELAKVYKKEGIGPEDVIFYTVKGEPTAYDVSKDMGIYHWGEVTENIVSTQVNDSNSKARWTMHPGQTVVVPKDLFDK